MKMLAASLSCCCSTCTAAYQLCIPSSPAPKGISDTPSHCATDSTHRPRAVALTEMCQLKAPHWRIEAAYVRALEQPWAGLPRYLWRWHGVRQRWKGVAETGARRRVGGRSTTRSRDR